MIAVVPCFAATAAIVKLHRQALRSISDGWTQQGEAALRAGHAATAIDDFRNALAYSRDDQLLHLRLAQALIADNRPLEARGYLVPLWDEEPGDGQVNMELARVAAQQGRAADAIRYYHGAIEGAWDERAEDHRRTARLELVEFLLHSGHTTEAQPELVALAGDLPADLTMRKGIGKLLLQAGLVSRAEQVFSDVIRLHPKDAEALGGAGVALYGQESYTKAAPLLERAVSLGNRDVAVLADAASVRLIVDSDPYQRRLARSERARRTMAAYTAATARLSECTVAHAEDPELNALGASAANLAGQHVDLRTLARDPDLLDTVMDFVFNVEETTAARCGEPQGLDRALRLLGAERKARQ